jgi:nitrogen regulatory protein P-II 1
MKEIKAIIRPSKSLDVVSELQKIKGLPGVTISDIRGFGKTRANDLEEKLIDDIEYVHKMKIEVVVPDEIVEQIINIIQTNAHTGNPGDGKIFVYDVGEVIKIRTNERGADAI